MKNGKFPLVSIITLVYNTGKFVINTIESIKNQTYSNVEHIIIDDYSSDNSVLLISNWIKNNSYKCNFIKNTQNLGIVANCNRGLSISKGDYLTFLGDDIMLPTRIKDAVEELTINSVYDMSYSDAFIVDENYNLLHESYVNFHGLTSPSGKIFIDYFNRIIAACAPTFFYRTSVLKEMGGFDESLKTEDWDSMLRITKKHLVYFSTTKNIQYLIRNGSASSTFYKMMGKDRLLVLEKWLDDDEIGYKVPDLALKYIASCYAKNDKSYALKWIKILEGRIQSFSYYILKYLIKNNMPKKLVLVIYYILKKMNLLYYYSQPI